LKSADMIYLCGFYIRKSVIYILWKKQNFQHHYSSLQCHMTLQKSL